MDLASQLPDAAEKPDLQARWAQELADEAMARRLQAEARAASAPAAGERVTEEFRQRMGVRVVRGDDWKWGNQDRNGSGAIIGDADTPGWVNIVPSQLQSRCMAKFHFEIGSHPLGPWLSHSAHSGFHRFPAAVGSQDHPSRARHNTT